MRLWQGRKVIVFVSPKEWKKVSMGGRVPMVVRSCGREFKADVCSFGEHFRSGEAKDIDACSFGVPSHGDYDATASIDWSNAIPEILRTRMSDSPELAARWRELSCDEMRSHLAWISRARRPGVTMDRQLAVAKALAEGGLDQLK